MIKDLISIRDPFLAYVQNKIVQTKLNNSNHKKQNDSIGYKDYSSCCCRLKCLQDSVP